MCTAHQDIKDETDNGEGGFFEFEVEDLERGGNKGYHRVRAAEESEDDGDGATESFPSLRGACQRKNQKIDGKA